MFMETPTAMMTIDTIPSHIQSEERDYNNNADDTGSVGGMGDYNDSADDTATSTKIVPTIQATPQTPTTKPIPEGDDNGAAKKTSSLLATKTVPTVQAMPTIRGDSSEDFVLLMM
jgi:hypothetical protein